MGGGGTIIVDIGVVIVDKDLGRTGAGYGRGPRRASECIHGHQQASFAIDHDRLAIGAKPRDESLGRVSRSVWAPGLGLEIDRVVVAWPRHREGNSLAIALVLEYLAGLRKCVVRAGKAEVGME